MRKSFFTLFFAFFLLLGVQTNAQSAGYSMGMIMDDVIIAVKVDDAAFSYGEYEEWSANLGQLLAEEGIPVFYHQDLGDADALRAALPGLYDSFQVIFIELSKGPAPVPSAYQNIWISFSYENWGMYIASVGINEQLTELAEELALFLF